MSQPYLVIRDWSWVNKCQRTVRPVKGHAEQSRAPSRATMLHFLSQPTAKQGPTGALRLRRTASSRAGALHRWQQWHQFCIESVRHVPAGASQNAHAYNRKPDNNTLNIIPAICRTPTLCVARGCGFWYLRARVGIHTLYGHTGGGGGVHARGRVCG